MKLSNFLLSILATIILGIAVGSSFMVVSHHSSAQIYVKGEAGDNLSIDLPKNLSHHQAELLSMAYDIAKKDGHEQPQLLQGIILQESKAGDMSSYKVAGQEMGLKTNMRYYGVAQIKLAAARDVLAKWPDLISQFEFHTNTDEEIIAKLIENDRFNLAIASKYLLIMKSYGYSTIKQLATAYNQGPGGAKLVDANNNKYSSGVQAHIQELKIK